MLLPGLQHTPLMDSGETYETELNVTSQFIGLNDIFYEYGYVRAGSAYSLIIYSGESYGSATGMLLPGTFVDRVLFTSRPDTGRGIMIISLRGHHAALITTPYVYLNDVQYSISYVQDEQILGYFYTRIVSQNIDFGGPALGNYKIRL